MAWSVRAARADPPQALSFEQWTSAWTSPQENSRLDAIPWARRTEPSRATHLVTPDELALDPTADAATTGGDGRTPGADIRALPPLAR